MKLNTVICLPDGREGTICYRNLDGEGGVWGRHTFEMPDTGFGPGLPAPEFMLRSPKDARLFHGRECVGTNYEIVSMPDEAEGR